MAQLCNNWMCFGVMVDFDGSCSFFWILVETMMSLIDQTDFFSVYLIANPWLIMLWQLKKVFSNDTF